ncbi:hypothetical protein AcW1_008043 [Taiwanofungus camphoratus]|nr:hypothetical protein AcW1_008043 [Antrodia cinnamomea]
MFLFVNADLDGSAMTQFSPFTTCTEGQSQAAHRLGCRQLSKLLRPLPRWETPVVDRTRADALTIVTIISPFDDPEWICLQLPSFILRKPRDERSASTHCRCQAKLRATGRRCLVRRSQTRSGQRRIARRSGSSTERERLGGCRRQDIKQAG